MQISGGGIEGFHCIVHFFNFFEWCVHRGTFRPEYNMLLILPIMLCSYSPYIAYYSLPLFPKITHYSPQIIL